MLLARQSSAHDPNLRFVVAHTLAALTLLCATPTRADGPESIDPYREFVIVHPAVVDPYLNGGRSSNGTATLPGGDLSLRTLLGRALQLFMNYPPAMQQFADALFAPLTQTQTLQNGEVLAPRNLAEEKLLSQFSSLDGNGNRIYELWKLPFELIAVVCRLDLRAADGSHAGELRLVYKLTNPDTGDEPMTLIMEYEIPTDWWSAETWAQRWHALSSFEIGSEEYMDKLTELTRLITGWRFTTPPRLLRVRINEKSLDSDGRWELREYRPGNDIYGLPVPSPVENTPPQLLNGTELLKRFIAQTPALGVNDPSFQSIVLPEVFEDGVEGATVFAAAKADMDSAGTFAWVAPGASPSDPPITQFESVAIDNFGTLTCNGCHQDNKAQGDMEFFHISPLEAPGIDGLARLSDFMTTADPERPLRRPADIERRRNSVSELLFPSH